MNTMHVTNTPIGDIRSHTNLGFYANEKELFVRNEEVHAKPFVQCIIDDSSCTSDDNSRSNKRKSTKYSPECLAYLHQWLATHLHNPYPDREEMECLAAGSGLSREQVNNWFTNTRKRKLKMNGNTTPTGSGIHGLKSSTSIMDITSRESGGMGMLPLHTDFIQQKYTLVSPGTFAPTTPCASPLCYVPLVTPNSINISKVGEKVKYRDNVHKQGPLFCADDTIDTEITEAEMYSLLNDSNKIWATRLTKLVTDMMEEADDTLVVSHVQKPAVSRYFLRDIGLDCEPFTKKSKYDA